jgi:hypothetical protein
VTEVTDAELDALIQQLADARPPAEPTPEFDLTAEFRYRVYFKGTLMARCVTDASARRIRAVLLKLPRPKARL